MSRLSRFGLACAFAGALNAAGVHAAEPDKLLPADADTVTYVNVKQMVESDVIKKYALDQIKQMLDGKEAKKILEQMGLDPLKDIDRVWIGSSGKDQNDMKAVVILRGKFDKEKLLKAAAAAAKKDGDKFSVLKDGETTLFKYQPDTGNPWYVAAGDETTVVAATDKKAVAAALKQAEGEKKAPIKAELTELVKAMDEKSSMFAVSVVKGKLDTLNNAAPPQQLPLDLSGVMKALPKTDTMTFALKVTGDINLELVLGMADEDAAADMDAGMAKVVDGIKGLVPLLAAADPKAKPLTDVVKTLKTSAKKKSVTVGLKVTGENLGKMTNQGD
jgi:hypothetical protein